MPDVTSIPPPLPPRKRGCRPGCGIGCLAVLVVTALLGFGAFRLAMNQYHTFMDRYEREGYRRVEGQYINVTNRPDIPTIYAGQVVKIQVGSDRGIALLCQQAEIKGDVVGNVHFVGQMLTVDKDAVLHRDLDIKAQVANVYGVVSGKITGVWQVLNRQSRPE